jgi:hypothetical protein
MALSEPAAWAAYALFAGLALVGPGVALQRLFRVPIDPALVLPVGTAACASLFWLSLVVHPLVFPAAILLLDLTLLARGPGPWKLASGPSLRGAIAPFVALVAVLAATQYPWNRRGADGDFLLDPMVPYDTAFHVGLTRELVLVYPPQVPGVAGFPIGYHLGIDLTRAAALRWVGTDPFDAITRFDVTLGALALVLLLRAITHRLGAPPAAVTFVPWTLLLTDFSFLFASNPQAHWWTDLLRGNLLLSLVAANPIVPALALVFGALCAFSRHLAGEGRGHVALAAALGFALPFFKVFLGAHLLLGLGVAALLAGTRALGPFAAVALPCAIATTALVLGQGGETVEVALCPLDLARVTRESLGLPTLHGAPFLAWSAFWIAASLGLRVFGLPAAWRALRKASLEPIGAVLAVMALCAWPLGLLFRVSAPDVLPGQKTVNDAAYLVEQGGPLLWIFTAIAVVSFAHGGARRVLAAVAVAVLATPATVQFVVKKATTPPDRIPAAMVRAMDALERVSRPGEVVLQRPGGRYPPVPVILIGRRVPYERFTPYLTQFARRADLLARHETVFRFFHTADAAEARAIAQELGARDVALYGSDRVRFEPAGLFEAIHEEAGARVYRMRQEARGDGRDGAGSGASSGIE